MIPDDKTNRWTLNDGISGKAALDNQPSITCCVPSLPVSTPGCCVYGIKNDPHSSVYHTALYGLFFLPHCLPDPIRPSAYDQRSSNPLPRTAHYSAAARPLASAKDSCYSSGHARLPQQSPTKLRNEK